MKYKVLTRVSLDVWTNVETETEDDALAEAAHNLEMMTNEQVIAGSDPSTWTFVPESAEEEQ